MDSRPGWATAVGIILILFGGCGAVNNIKMVRTDDMVKMTNSIMDNMEVDIGDAELDSSDIVVLETLGDTIVRDSTQKIDLRSTIAKLMYMSDYFKKWAVVTGWAGIVVAVLFIIAGALFFGRKKMTIPFTIVTLIISMIYAALKIYIFSQDSSSEYILGGVTFSAGFSMFLDLLILTVVLVCDKTYYMGDGEDFN